ncbi:MAG TPA: hypothetical protein VGD17_12295 [Chitinophagaceae bacterium]
MGRVSTVLQIFLLLVITGWSCKKSQTETPAIRISGIALTNSFGASIGYFGDQDQDWTLLNSLPPAEMAVLDFTSSHKLDNTTEAGIQSPIKAYPNPMAASQAYNTLVSDSVIVRIAVVNEYLDVLKTASFKAKGPLTFTLDYSNRTEFPIGTLLRVYYSYSATGKPHYKVGYGDIMICNSLSQNGSTGTCK